MKLLKIIRNIKNCDLSELQLIKKYIDKQISKKTNKSTLKILEEAKSLNIFNDEDIKAIEKEVFKGQQEINELNEKLFKISQNDIVMKLYEKEIRKMIEEEKRDEFIKKNIEHTIVNQDRKYQF